MENHKYKVDVIIPVYKPDNRFGKLLMHLIAQQYPIHNIIIMNTDQSWWDGHDMAETVSKSVSEVNLRISKESALGKRHINSNTEIKIYHVDKKDFDHGGTRDLGVSRSEADILLFLTQDAMPKNDRLLENLVNAFKDPQVAVAYGRQLPTKDCRIIERYTRSFNYPETGRVKTKEDIPKLGVKAFFASNVCAAYRRETYDKLGGFLKHTIFNEDMIYAGKALFAGYKTAYCSQAMVIHSHNYTALEYMRRNFDLGVSQADHPEIFAGVRSEGEGIRLVKDTAAYLINERKPHLIPALIAVSGFKFVGYRLGKGYKKLPGWMIRHLTMNRSYWNIG